MEKGGYYYSPIGGLPNQEELTLGKAKFNASYLVIPSRSLTDIVTSLLPFWEKTRLWVLARPMSGFSHTFAHYLMEVEEGGGSDLPRDDDGVESVLFVTEGLLELKYGEGVFILTPGSYVYLPPSSDWELLNIGDSRAVFHWILKQYEFVSGIPEPEFFVSHDDKQQAIAMPETNGAWTTTRFVDPNDLGHDMHVNIVTFQPGASIPFLETHVMEHGIFILEGKAVYNLNGDWIEVEEGDYLWLRAFCPQACYAAGPSQFKYLLYKDVNRHPKLSNLSNMR
ncbi:MAG: bifunctional allantoicase/(S)-ureidoglycine aminohydrolase [Rhodobacteraceae bacterium]|nr:bifunctional allantoicase/(S)-ureidoglycine aminohydrolase [Paracoccaceae bacterium]